MTPAALAALEALVEALCEGEPFASYEECAAFWAHKNNQKRAMRKDREEKDNAMQSLRQHGCSNSRV